MTTIQDSPNCYNCGRLLEGPFCASCGQKASPLNPHVADVVHELAHEALHFDGRIFQSVKKLFVSPGFLTREYFEGRRARWISPVRLYLTLSVVYFAIAAISPGSPVHVRVSGEEQDTSAQIQQLGFANEQDLSDAINHAWTKWTPRIMFLLVPLFAWLVTLAFRRSHYTYVQHLFFALHVHAAWFAAGAVAAVVRLLVSSGVGKIAQGLLVVYCVTYTFLALRRAYGRTTGEAAKRAAFIIPVYGVALIATVVAIALPVIFGRLWVTRLSALRLESTVLAQAAPSPAVREEANVHGRKGWVLENGKVHVAILQGGGHIAEIRLMSGNPKLEINPMFIPAGNGYMGHMVCFPNFGPASPEERQSGIGGHGEANAVDWEQTRPPQIDAQGITFYYGADLPRTQYRIGRAIHMNTGEAQIDIEEWVENLTSYDRPYNWDEHATFGAPFAAPDRTVLDMSGTKAMSDPRRTANNQWAVNREFVWPDAPKAEGGTISLREFHAVPNGQVYTAVLADQSRPVSWFTMFNRDYPLLVGYAFPTADHPWIIDWQNQPQAGSPVGVARGIEFGTSPVDEGLRKSVERAQMFGVPTYKFIAAKQRISTTFNIFLSEIPTGFAGVQDVRSVDGRFQVVPRK